MQDHQSTFFNLAKSKFGSTQPQYSVIMFDNCRSAGVPLEDWVTIHESLSKEIRRAAKVVLGKAVSKVQHFTMSGIS